MFQLRLVRVQDAPLFLDFYTRNWKYLEPWSPIPPEGFHSLSFQKRRLQAYMDRYRRGDECRFGVFGTEAGKETLVCSINLVAIERAAFENARLGYSTAEEYAGKGVTTANLQKVCSYAFDKLKLHRLEANVMPRNVASARVLEKCGFQKVGHSPAMLNICGKWEDHDMWARIRTG